MKDTETYRDALKYAQELANETGLPSVIKQYADGSCRVQTVSFRDEPEEFQIVEPQEGSGKDM